MDYTQQYPSGAEKKISNAEIEQLVEKAQQGDIDAFGQIYDLYVQKIYRYIFFKVRKEEALDMTETVFLKTWENINKYRKREGSSFAAWVFRIAHNLIVDHHRFHQDIVALDPSVRDLKKESNPELVTEQALSKDTVRSALTKLKGNYQEVLTHFYINDLNHLEIAQIMRKSEGSLRVLKFRALKELKRVLLDMGIKY